MTTRIVRWILFFDSRNPVHSTFEPHMDTIEATFSFPRLYLSQKCFFLQTINLIDRSIGISLRGEMSVESSANENQRRRRRSIVRQFCLNTSTHALPGIARSESLHNRVFWSISFVFFTGVMLYFIVQSIRSFFDYPTTIDVNIDNEWPQNFPAFSFCNAGGHRFDLFIDPFLNFTRTKNLSVSRDPSTWTTTESLLIRTHIIDGINENRSFDRSMFALPDLLYRCRFNGDACSTSDFLRFYSSSFGLCFTFNAQLRNSSNATVRPSHLNGGSGELLLELYVHRHQYLPFVADGSIFECSSAVILSASVD
jgi:hypothetical protein